MNRAGKKDQLQSNGPAEQNLRKRVLLLSFFALFLVFINILPFYRSFVLKSAPELTLFQGMEEAVSQANFAPGSGPYLYKTAALFKVADTAAAATMPGDCSTPAELAPFLGLAMDINRARAKELTLLPGIGQVLGQRIVAEREKNGPYRSPDELLRVTGIGTVILAGLQPHVCTR